MEITAPNSINHHGESVPGASRPKGTEPGGRLYRWQHIQSRRVLRKELAFMQRIVDGEREQRVQALADYDQVEEELKTLLSIDSSITPNQTLLAMAHEDLAIYADQMRSKYLRLVGDQRAA